MTKLDDATNAQNRAAAPDVSTWLTANAGSGKTRVLTDRVARLLLAGTAPEHILCLTYTKAAASEMQNRLLAQLGRWAMLAGDDLRAELARIGAEEGADLPAARRLFARAIEAPGGLKVQTIHAFCASILRRFPLEAGVPHGFTELDERSASLLRAEVLDRMVEENAPEIADLTAIHSGHDLDRWLAVLTGADSRIGPPDHAALCQFAGIAPDDTSEALVRDMFAGLDAQLIRAVIKLAETGSKNDQKLADRLSAGNWDAPDMAEVEILENTLLFGAGAKAAFGPKLGKVLTKATLARFDQGDALDALAEQVAENRLRRIGLDFVDQAMALHRFGHVFNSRYQAAKLARGWLDFDDLITRTDALLSKPDMAPWVLYRLDGGIEHILVDEAQDTSPAQWRVIRHLTDEFMAGKGAADQPRTLFVVGDPKQSIYSFQGADIAVFADRHDEFAAGFAAAGMPMQDAALRHSFRSSPAVLQLVDAIFEGESGRGLGGTPEHIAFHAEMPGRVDLWPVVEPPEKPEERQWDDPLDLIHPEDAPARLAEGVAEGVAAMLGQPIRLRDGAVRPIRAGDVLILVQRRSALFHQIIAALKRRHLPVAGADRLRLGGELAVRDIRALLAFLATPEDDLSLASTLRSPLFGLSEDGLYRLAAGRAPGEFLWARMRAAGPESMHEVLSDLLSMTGALRPYELISRILLRHGGRERLIARLGPEADDGIDELLSQALAYEAKFPPSLTGFLVWLEEDDVEVRRQPGSAGEGEGLIRVMTVHGAKGLESPVVLVPDGAKRRQPRGDSLLRQSNGPALPRGRADMRPEALQKLVDDQSAANEEERRRLLYVALTRAESWLILGAAGEAGEDGDSWHSMVAAGFDRAAARGLVSEVIDTPVGPDGRRIAVGDWPVTQITPATPVAEAPPSLPDWLLTRPPDMSPPPRPVAASGLGGAFTLEGTEASADAPLFGTRLHLLLEHWDRLAGIEDAQRLLADAEGGAPDGAMLDLLWSEAEAVTSAAGMTELFRPAPGDKVLTEVPLTAPVPGLGVLHGVLDRLLIGPDRVQVIDYKSNRMVPDRPEDVPLGILRQMAGYHTAVAAIWPDRRVEVAILWTAARRLMVLPEALLLAEAARLGTPPLDLNGRDT